MEALDSKRILNTLKKGITSAMECADVAGFTFATGHHKYHCFFFASLYWQKRQSLIYLHFCKYFLWVKAIKVNSFAV